MSAYVRQTIIQLRLDARDRITLVIFYIVPLAFYGVMGAVFSSINPDMQHSLAATMTIYAITMGAVIGLPPTLVKLRETKVLRAYRAAGIPSAGVLSGLGVSALLHVGVVSAVISVSAPLLFGASPPSNLAGFMLVLLAQLFCGVALGLLIGATAKNQAMAMMLSQAVFLPSLMLSGVMFPANMLPKPLELLGLIFPATHALRAFMGLAYGLDVNHGTLSLVVLFFIGISAAIVTVWRLAYITRVN